MAIYRLADKVPTIDATAYVAVEATIIGSVTLNPKSSVWANVVIRGDNEPIVVGEGSNIQEGAVLHVDPGYPLTVGCNVTVGHQAMLHGCTIGDGSLVGMQAILLNGAVIGRNCLVAAGAVVTEGKTFPDNSLILGAPAKVVRELTAEQIEAMHRNTAHYVKNAAYFKENLQRIDKA